MIRYVPRKKFDELINKVNKLKSLYVNGVYTYLHPKDFYKIGVSVSGVTIFPILKKYYPNTKIFRDMYPEGSAKGNFWVVEDII